MRDVGGADDGGAVALKVRDLAVSYGKSVAVESASFEVREGECVALIGPNGHGKSTLVNAIAGLLAHRGEVRLFGEPLHMSDPGAAVRAGLVLVPERRHLYPDLTVRENILLGRYVKTTHFRADRVWKDVSHTLERFPELRDRTSQKAGTLSGGQQQMVALARAMASDPRVIMLDEPCLGLAEAVSVRVYDWLREIAKTRVTIVLVEENPVHALEISDRAVRIYKGLVGDDAGADSQAPATGSALA